MPIVSAASLNKRSSPRLRYNTKCYTSPEAEVIRVFKTKLFARFVRKNSIRESDLCKAIDELIAGSVDADLGSGLFKQRVARQGGGKSGGFRTIIAFRTQSVAFFVFGFAKKDAANIEPEGLQQLRKLARFLLSEDEAALNKALAEGKLIEVKYGKETIQ